MAAMPGELAPDAGAREPTAEEIEAFGRDGLFEQPGGLTADDYPRAGNMSAGFPASGRSRR